MKSLKQLYGGVEGYNFEEEYNIIALTIEHERMAFVKAPTYADVFRGTNRVSLGMLGPRPWRAHQCPPPETYFDGHDPIGLWSIGRSCCD